MDGKTAEILYTEFFSRNKSLFLGAEIRTPFFREVQIFRLIFHNVLECSRMLWNDVDDNYQPRYFPDYSGTIHNEECPLEHNRLIVFCNVSIKKSCF